MAVGTGGTFLRYVSGTWQTVATNLDGNNTTLRDLGVGPNYAYVVGNGATVVRVDSSNNKFKYTNLTLLIGNANVTSVFGLSDTDIYVCGGAGGTGIPYILHGTP